MKYFKSWSSTRMVIFTMLLLFSYFGYVSWYIFYWELLPSFNTIVTLPMLFAALQTFFVDYLLQKNKAY